MTSPLHQLTMTYSPEQDRVMLRLHMDSIPEK